MTPVLIVMLHLHLLIILILILIPVVTITIIVVVAVVVVSNPVLTPKTILAMRITFTTLTVARILKNRQNRHRIVLIA